MSHPSTVEQKAVSCSNSMKPTHGEREGISKQLAVRELH